MEVTNPIRNYRHKFVDTFKKLIFQYHFWVFYIWMSIVSLILTPLFLFRPRNVKNFGIWTKMIKHVSKLIGVKWCLRNQNIVGEKKGAVIVANHQSSLDILGMTTFWDAVDKCAMVAKSDLIYSPIGPAAYLMGTIFVDRKQGRESQIKLRAQAESYFKNKVKVWIFPEGTRNDNMKMLPFKKGAFISAITSQVPVIPVVFSPYHFINKKKMIFNKGNIIVQCLDPIPTEGLTLDDLPALVERVQNIMERTYSDLVLEVTKDLPDNYALSK